MWQSQLLRKAWRHVFGNDSNNHERFIGGWKDAYEKHLQKCNKKEKLQFLEWVDSLDSIKPVFITRDEYDTKHNSWENILIVDDNATHIENKPIPHILYLPEDMKSGDVLHIIEVVTKQLGNEQYFTQDRVAQRLKAQLVVALDKAVTKKDIEDLKNKYHLSNEVIDKIMKAPIKLSQYKAAKKSENIHQNINQTISLWLDGIFLDRWKQTLWDFMSTFTQNDYEQLPWENKEDLQKNKYPYLTSDEVKKYFNKVEKNIWQKIVDENKTILEKYNSSDIKENQWMYRWIQSLLTNTIGLEIRDLPWQEINWHNIKKALQNKEVQCLMKAFLCHIYLTKFWIKHKTIQLLWHIALTVYIWWKRYLFDTNWLSRLIFDEFPIENDTNHKWYTGNDMLSKLYKASVFRENEPNIWLQSALYNNTWYFRNNNISYYNKALALTPNSPIVLNNRWAGYFGKWEYNKALEDLNKAISICNDYKFSKSYHLLRAKIYLRTKENISELVNTPFEDDGLFFKTYYSNDNDNEIRNIIEKYNYIEFIKDVEDSNDVLWELLDKITAQRSVKISNHHS